MGDDMARAVLAIELPVPAGREDEWNRWYHDEHIPDMWRSVPGVVRSVRYEIVGAQRYVALHEFESEQKLRDYLDSGLMDSRWQLYEDQWGAAPSALRRGFVPVYDQNASATS